MRKRTTRVLVLTAVLLLILGGLIPQQYANAAPSGIKVGSSTTLALGSHPFQRKTFYAEGEWAVRSSGSSDFYAGVAYGNDTFVVVGGSSIITSPDGTSWIPGPSGTLDALSDVTFGNGIFVAVGDAGTILTSTDGVNWKAQNSGTTWYLYRVTYGNDLFVAVGYGGTILTSPDGANWIQRDSGLSSLAGLQGVAYGNGKYVAVGYDESIGSTGIILVSTNGEDWTITSTDMFYWLTGITFGNGQFVVSSGFSMVLTSPDAVDWAMRTDGIPPWVWLTGVSYGNGKFMAVGSYGSILSSFDGVLWNEPVSGTTNWLYGAGHGNGLFVAVGDEGILLTSSDRGLFWVFYSDGTNLVYNTSPDGMTWSAPTPIRACTSGDNFSIWYDGLYAHYALVTDGRKIHYGRGIPSSTGVWVQSTPLPQVAVPAASGMTYSVPTIAVDSDGYPWIGYRMVDSFNNKRPMVTKSSRNDGTWNGSADTASGFPYRLENWTAAYWVVVPIPLTYSKMLVIYTSHGHFIRARSWDGYAWRPKVTSTGLTHTQNAVTANLFSAVGQGDEVHVVFLETSLLRYMKYNYDYNWWDLYPINPYTRVPEVIIQKGVTSTSAPVLSIDPAGTLHLFWAGAPLEDHIFYKKTVAGLWQDSFQDWIDEHVERLTSNTAVTTIYHDAGNGPGVLYLTRKTRPYKVKFDPGH